MTPYAWCCSDGGGTGVLVKAIRMAIAGTNGRCDIDGHGGDIEMTAVVVMTSVKSTAVVMMIGRCGDDGDRGEGDGGGRSGSRSLSDRMSIIVLNRLNY